MESSEFLMLDPWEASQGEYQRSLIVLRSVQDRLAAALEDAPTSSEGQRVTISVVRVSTLLFSRLGQASWEGLLWRGIHDALLLGTFPPYSSYVSSPRTITVVANWVEYGGK